MINEFIFMFCVVAVVGIIIIAINDFITKPKQVPTLRTPLPPAPSKKYIAPPDGFYGKLDMEFAYNKGYNFGSAGGSGFRVDSQIEKMYEYIKSVRQRNHPIPKENTNPKNMTALEFIQSYLEADNDFMESMMDQMKSFSGFNFDNIPDLMAAYAKYEVEQALKSASKAKFKSSIGESYVEHTPNAIEAILASYPLDNIKAE